MKKMVVPAMLLDQLLFFWNRERVKPLPVHLIGPGGAAAPRMRLLL